MSPCSCQDTTTILQDTSPVLRLGICADRNAADLTGFQYRHVVRTLSSDGNASSNAVAALISAVVNPSVNRLYTPCKSAAASAERPWSRHSRARLAAVRSSQKSAPWRRAQSSADRYSCSAFAAVPGIAPLENEFSPDAQEFWPNTSPRHAFYNASRHHQRSQGPLRPRRPGQNMLRVRRVAAGKRGKNLASPAFSSSPRRTSNPAVSHRVWP